MEMLKCQWNCRDVRVIFGDVSVTFRHVEMSVNPSRCQWGCGVDVSGPVKMLIVDLSRCQSTCQDVSGSVEMSVDLSRCQWICGDFSGPVLEMSVDLSRCQ